MTSAKSKWLLINVLYIVSRDDLGRIGWNLRKAPIFLLIFWMIFFMYSTKFSVTSNFNPRCFWEILFFKGMLLKERQGWSSFLVFLLNITSWACLVKSKLKLIPHWKAQLLIKSLREVAVLDWVSLTTEKKDVFFLSGVFFHALTNHRTTEEGGGHFFNSSLPFPPASQALRH